MKNKCKFCKKGFSSTNIQQMYCSEKCRSANGWEKYKERNKNKVNIKMFDWSAFKNDMMV